MAGEPVRSLFQVIGQVGQGHPDGAAAQGVAAALQVLPQQCPLAFPVVVVLAGAQQHRQFLHQFRFAAGAAPVQLAEQGRQRPQIARVGTGEGHALAPVGGHIQGIVPVGPPQAVEVVLAHIVEGGELLQQQMFQQGAAVDLPGFGALPAALFGGPGLVDAVAPHRLGVLEVGGLAVQQGQVAGLVQIELGGHLGPEGVVHPDPGNAVAVGDEVAVPGADDGGVGAVHPHPRSSGPPDRVP